MNTKDIIDYCLKGVGEEDVDNPVEVSREDVLLFINTVYQGPIARRLKLLKSHSYDGSDSDHTITAGVGTLPSDFMQPSRVYDGDAPESESLEQIIDIDDKVADTSKTRQYMLPNMSEIWIFGKTPSNTIKMYYYFEPPALSDDSTSNPSYLKKEFHVKPFAKVIQEWYSTKNADFFDEQELEIFLQDILNEIEDAHSMRDDAPKTVKVVW